MHIFFIFGFIPKQYQSFHQLGETNVTHEIFILQSLHHLRIGTIISNSIDEISKFFSCSKHSGLTIHLIIFHQANQQTTVSPKQGHLRSSQFFSIKQKIRISKTTILMLVLKSFIHQLMQVNRIVFSRVGGKNIEITPGNIPAEIRKPTLKFRFERDICQNKIRRHFRYLTKHDPVAYHLYPLINFSDRNFVSMDCCTRADSFGTGYN